MFAYCGNNPVMGYDPDGEWNWGGVIAGLGIIAATVITVATLGIGTGVGAIIAAAAVTTGAAMTYAAATDSALSIDVSASVQCDADVYLKGGVSIVLDFSDDGGIYAYAHGGTGVGYSTGVSYSVGVVDNLKSPDDYTRHSIDVSAGSTLGIDHSFDPTRPYSSTTKTTAITFGSGYSFGVGYDYYSNPFIISKWRTK